MTRLSLTNAALGIALGCALSVGCGDDSGDDNTTGDASLATDASVLGDGGLRSDAGTLDAGGDAAVVIKGSATAGMAVITMQACGACHTGTAGLLAGQSSGSKGANITPDIATGIGSWSEAQIVTALLTGKDDEGKQLCATMPIYATVLKAQEAADAAAYLKSIPAVSNKSVEPCQ